MTLSVDSCAPPVLEISLALALVITFCSRKPLQEFLGCLPDLPACGNIDVFLAGLAAPSLDNFLRDEVVLIEAHKNGGNLRDEFVWMILANEALSAAEECLLMAIRSDHLLEHGSTSWNLLNNVFVEDCLGQHGEGLVLVLD